jgi:formylmethanofuran dehydrogenase subunit E
MEYKEIDMTGIPAVMFNPRQRIQHMIQEQDIRGLMEKAVELHGHLCSFVTLGIRAGASAVRLLREDASDGMEKVTCIIECNNCFSDGVQITTGCTFGNNALIYRDLGKNAFTLIRRGGRACRVAVRTEAMERINALRETIYPGAEELFNKVVTRRSGTSEESELLKRVFLKLSYELLAVPEHELLVSQEVRIESEKYAPIFKSCRCASCGERVMESRARLRDEKVLCIPCAQDFYFQLDGFGISQKK